jgi:hypothetical protein
VSPGLPSARWASATLYLIYRSVILVGNTSVIDEEGGGSKEEKGKLELPFYPELDHAMVFDTKERRRPILARFRSN